MRIFRQLDEGLLLPDSQRDGMDRRGRKGLIAAGGALLLFGFLVGVLGLLAALVPDLFDSGGDDLQGLERLNRFLVEAKDEELPPMSHFGGIAFDLAENILGCLRGEIHIVIRPDC